MSVMRARIAMAAGGMLASCGLCAGQSEIVPVGPVSDGHTPIAINEAGDVLFDVWTALEPGGPGPGDPWSVSEVWYADGAVLRGRGPGGTEFRARALSEQGQVLGYVSPPPPGGPITDFWVLERSGGFHAVEGTRAIPIPRGFSPDGRVFGSTTESTAWGDDGPLEPSAPMVWTVAGGAAELATPPEFPHGGIRWARPGGGYVGSYGDGKVDGEYWTAWWDDAGSLEAAAPPVTFVDGEVVEYVGVRADDALVGHVGGRIVEFTRAGELRFLTDAPELFLETVDVNASGLIVGEIGRWERYEYVYQPTVWGRNGREVSLLPYFEQTGWSIGSVVDVNDRGDVLVHAFRGASSEQEHRAFVIRGVPGAGTGVAVGGVVLSLALRRRREAT